MRPILVSILAVLIILAGIFFLVLGIFFLIGTAYMATTPLKTFVPVTLVAALIVLIVGAILTISGVGLWRLRLWAWALAIVVIIFALVGQITGFSICSFLILVFLLIYLIIVKEHFY